jgi:hypothetical protein
MENLGITREDHNYIFFSRLVDSRRKNRTDRGMQQVQSVLQRGGLAAGHYSMLTFATGY